MLVLMNEIFILKSTVIFFSLIFNFMPLQNKCCTGRSTLRLPLLAERKKQKKNCLNDLISSMYVYSFGIHDSQSRIAAARVSGSLLQSH